MSLTLSIKDIHCLQKLCILTSLFLITPWYDISSRAFRWPNFSKLYGLCIFALKVSAMLVTFLVDAHYKFFQSLLFTQKLVFVLFCLIDIVQFLSQILSSLHNTTQWQRFFTNFQHIDQRLNNVQKQEPSLLRNYYVRFLAANLAFLAFFTVEFNYWAKLIFHSSDSVLLLTCLEAYNQFLVIAFVRIIFVSLLVRYKELNRWLIAGTATTPTAELLQTLQQLFRLLHENVEIFNSIFGYQIFFLIVCAGLHIINIANFTFVHINFAERSTQIHATIFNLVMTAFMMISLFLVIIPCEKIQKEAEKFVRLCYVLQDGCLGRAERRILLRMVEECRFLQPHFNTAGYLKLRKRLVFGLLGTVASYFIVVVEFNESEHKHVNISKLYTD